jgi:hypothetical protein
MVVRFHGEGFPSIHNHPEGYHDHPGWYDDDENEYELGWECVTFVNDIGFDAYWAKFDNACQWVQDNVSNWQTATRFIRINDGSYFYFLNPNDAMLFKLMCG